MHSSNAQSKAAKIEAVRERLNERNEELYLLDGTSDPNARVEQARSIVDRAKTASEYMKNLAKDPLKYIGTAKEVMTQRFPSIGAKMPSTGEAIEGFKTAGLTSEDFLTSARVFSYAGVALAVTSIILAAVADRDHWGRGFAQAAIDAGAGAVLSAVLTESAITTVMTASLTAMGVSAAAMPPLLPVAIAAGMVIAIGIAISELVQFLIKTGFGSGEIPASMASTMASTMASEMANEMASEMAASMESSPT